jgi:hypothetical protein
MAETIICPNCQYEIEVHAAAAAQMRDHIRKELEAEVRRKENEIAARERTLRLQEQELESSRESLDQELQLRLSQRRAALLEEAETALRESLSHEITGIQEELAGTKVKLAEAQSTELELRRDRRILEEQKRELELTVNRRLDEERHKIREEARNRAIEENRLRDADKEKLVGDLRRQIDDLKRSAELGSQQAQGEVLEVELENVLRRQFPCDTIEAVPRSVHGGDVFQHVFDNNGQSCGTILWESKRTKSWNDNWLPKLRDDQRSVKAHLAALLTAELPKNLTNFGCVDGTWVTNRACLVGLAAALRVGLIEAARARSSIQGKYTKVDLVFQYLAGSEFRQKIEGIVEAFVAMKHDLESEKRSLHRIWIKREKHIDRAVANTAGLYGELGGIIGANLPRIALLELDLAITDEPADHPSSVESPLEEAAF